MNIEGISAITFMTRDMARACEFYRALGFELKFGGPGNGFTSFYAGSGFLNVMRGEPPGFWGRAILYVDDVDAFHANAVRQGLEPETEPRDAHWGERYFHIRDPDGNELSFARPLDRNCNRRHTR